MSKYLEKKLKKNIFFFFPERETDHFKCFIIINYLNHINLMYFPNTHLCLIVHNSSVHIITKKKVCLNNLLHL